MKEEIKAEFAVSCWDTHRLQDATVAAHAKAHEMLCAADRGEWGKVRELANELSDDSQRISHWCNRGCDIAIITILDREHHTKFEDRTKEIALLIRGLQRDLDNLGFSLTYD